MSDFFATWARSQEKLAAAHADQLRAATRALGAGEHFDGAIKAAQDIHSAQTRAWESWMAMWSTPPK